jgi:hypothetical protein
MLFLWRANHARDESELRMQSFAAGVAYDSSTWPYLQKGARFKRSSQSGAEAQFRIIPPPSAAQVQIPNFGPRTGRSTNRATI